MEYLNAIVILTHIIVAFFAGKMSEKLNLPLYDQWVGTLFLSVSLIIIELIIFK